MVVAGVFEILLLGGVVLAIVYAVRGRRRTPLQPTDSRADELAAALAAERHKVDELESKLASSREGAAFTEALLKGRQEAKPDSPG